MSLSVGKFVKTTCSSDWAAAFTCRWGETWGTDPGGNHLKKDLSEPTCRREARPRERFLEWCPARRSLVCSRWCGWRVAGPRGVIRERSELACTNPTGCAPVWSADVKGSGRSWEDFLQRRDMIHVYFSKDSPDYILRTSHGLNIAAWTFKSFSASWLHLSFAYFKWSIIGNEQFYFFHLRSFWAHGALWTMGLSQRAHTLTHTHTRIVHILSKASQTLKPNNEFQFKITSAPQML